MTKAVLIGGSSFIGSEMILYNSNMFLPTYNINKLSNGIKFDICNEHLSEKIKIKDFKTYVILSAISNPKNCENEEFNSFNINVICMKRLIDELISLDRHIVFFSSEYVYPGNKSNYKEDHLISPINEYGNQKYNIERYIIKKTKNFCILRLAKTYSFLRKGNDFHSQWFKSLVKKNIKEISCFTDQIFSPVSTFEIYKSLNFVISNKVKGIFNLGGSRSYSRIECLRLFLNKFNLNDIKIIPSLINEKNLGFRMPKNVSMDISKILNLGIKIKSYKENLYEL